MSGSSDSEGRKVKFGQSKKQPRKSCLEIIAPQAWEKQALGWDEKSQHEAQLKDANTGPALGWCNANERPDWSAVDNASPVLRALWRQYDPVRISS